jgi:hypothetical protein
VGKTFKDARDHRAKEIIRHPKIGFDGHLFDGEYDEVGSPEGKRHAKKLARRARRRVEIVEE